MTAYYNEADPFAAQWLRNLIQAGHIAPGEVDERSIEDVKPSDLRGFKQCHFFAGIGGWSYALRMAGWSDDRAVWTGSCPCQPFSEAGKGFGVVDERHLWPAWFWIIAHKRPSVIFGEQVSRAAKQGWLDILADELESEDYSVEAAVLSPTCVGSPHQRERLFFAANTLRSDAARRPEDRWRCAKPGEMEGAWWTSEGFSNFDSYERLADGLPSRVAKAIAGGFGNAIVPQVAAEFIAAYMETQ